jgi:putative membrane protein
MPFTRILLAAFSITVASVLAPAAPAASAQGTVSAQDRTFLVQAHQSNLAEIAAGRLAQTKGTADVVRSIGALLIKDHTDLDAALKPTAAKLGVSLPSQPAPDQQAEQQRLTALSGTAFDRAWVEAMIRGHRAALAAGQEELRSGTAPEAKEAARSSAPVIQHHLDELLRAQQTVGAPSSVPAGVPAGTGGEAATATTGGPGDGLGYGLLAAGLVLALGGALMWARPALWRR